MRAAEAAREAFISQVFVPATLSGGSAKERNAHPPVSQPAMPLVPDYPQNERQLSKWLTSHLLSDSVKSEGQQSFTLFDPVYDERGAALLPVGRKVLFIGDSMMEGVAPRVLKLLKEGYQVEGINLSKRSTGLAYPGFFNWPETTAKALVDNTNIGLLVVFLGPNDPWDIPVRKGQPYLRFGSEAWEAEYRGRIRQILALGQKYNIPVIWVLPPNMQKQKLSQGMTILSPLYESEVKSVGGIVVSVNNLFGYQGGLYTPSVMINGKRVNVRTSDGIHYTPAGAQIIAKAIFEKIHYLLPVSENSYEE